MENKKVAKVLISLIVLVTFSVLVVLIFKRIGSSKVADNKNALVSTSASALVAEPAILETCPLELKHFKAYFVDKNGKKLEVTDSVQWTSDNVNFITISNEDPIRGQVSALSNTKEGDYQIKATFQGKEAIATLKVVKAELKISCVVSPTSARVGEKVTWIMFFDKIGTPRYTYSITGSEGLNSKNSYVHINYRAPGEKTVKMKAIDYAGNEAEVTCDPYNVLPR